MKKHIPTLACLMTLTITASLRAEPAHEHGIAHLQVALEGQALRADFDLPGMDLLGFEHAPASAADEAAVVAAGTKMRDAAAVLVLTPAAQCSVEKVDFRAEKPEPGSVHMDFVASDSFRCVQPAELRGFKTGIFTLFPTLTELAVESQSPAGVRAQKLSSGSPDYAF